MHCIQCIQCVVCKLFYTQYVWFIVLRKCRFVKKLYIIFYVHTRDWTNRLMNSIKQKLGKSTINKRSCAFVCNRFPLCKEQIFQLCFAIHRDMPSTFNIVCCLEQSLAHTQHLFLLNTQ